uniref:Uncharacterized protein n=1 Tax=Caenorhabditis japonica TaxID=281687 RepID=A0A8R1EVI3_CAEJA
MCRSRKVGGVVKLAPRGKFIHGTTYRYWETPNYEIITNDGLVSADRCKRIGGLYSCEQSSANCTYYKTTGCILRTVETDGTFIKEIDDSSFVATVLKKYTVFNDTGSVTKIVGESGQLFLSMPNTYQAIFGSHVINGRHQAFQEVDIIMEDSIPSMNHNEINQFVKDQIKADFLISEQRVKKLHGIVPWSFSADNISYWVFENVGVILVVIGVLALLLFVYYCGPNVWVLRRKMRNKDDSIPKHSEFLEC